MGRGLSPQPHDGAQEGSRGATALTEFHKDVLGLIKCHLLKGLSHEDFNRSRVPVLRGRLAQQMGLWGQPGWPQPMVSSARTRASGARVCQEHPPQHHLQTHQIQAHWDQLPDAIPPTPAWYPALFSIPVLTSGPSLPCSPSTFIPSCVAQY